MERTIQNGDYVLIVYDEKRRWVVQVKEGETFHTNKGLIEFDSIIGKPFGIRVQSSRQRDFLIFAPTPVDFLFKTVRKTQIIYPKDASFLVVNTGIGPGSRVVEAGAGSGGLTSILAYYVQSDGKVFSYELREEFYKKAQKTLIRMGLDKFVELKNRDILDGIEEKEIDVVILDLATPWEVVPVARGALKSGGNFASFSPTINQVQETVDALKKHNFGDIWVSELILRSWQISSRNKSFLAIRPKKEMVGHTGFLTFARKIVI